MQSAHRATWADDWIGRVVGSYRLLRVLGTGGMGVVFLAEHVRMGRVSAIKILHPELKTRPEVAQRLQAEARAMGRLRHPGIVAILDQDTLPDGTGFLVMEYLQGQSLRQLMHKTSGALGLETALRVLYQCAAAMAAAHAAGVIHRDLSPANIFCLQPEATDATTTDTAIATVKILDFGLARLYSPEGASSSSHNTTRDGVVLGTLKYMAPEQCLDAHSVDEPADVYSLGAIGYELLCGRPPFVAASSWELIERHLREPPPPLSERARADDSLVPTELRTLIGEMLAKSPVSRPSMAQVAERLAGWLPDVSRVSISQPLPVSLQPSRRQRRHRRMMLRAGAALLCLSLCLSLGGVGWYAYRQRRSVARQRQQTLAATAEILTIIRRTLRPMPGANAASQGLLELTGHQLQTLLEQMPEDLEVQEALVRLHTLRGDFARHHGGLGTAKSEFEQAIAGAHALVQKRPQDRGYRLLLANAHDGLGDALEQVADLLSAKRQYEQALHIRQALLREAPGDSLPLQEVVGSYLLLGDLAQAQGRQRSALSAYEQALALIEPLWKTKPDNKAYRWQMCGVQYRLGQTLLNLGRSVDGLALAERAMDLLSRIAPTDQQGSSYHVLLSRILQLRGTARDRLGRRAEAEADFRTSLHEVSALLKAAPNDVQAKRAVIDSGLKLVDHWVRHILGSTGRAGALPADQAHVRPSPADEAGSLAAELLRLGEQLFATDESNHGHRWRLAATLQRVGDVELIRGQSEAAQKRFQRALELQESLHMQAPESARHRDRLVALLERLGDALAAGPYAVQAVPQYNEALRQIGEQEQLEPGWFELRLWQARILRKRSAVHDRLGRSSVAGQDQRNAHEILSSLQKQDPTDASVQAEQAALSAVRAVTSSSSASLVPALPSASSSVRPSIQTAAQAPSPTKLAR